MTRTASLAELVTAGFRELFTRDSQELFELCTAYVERVRNENNPDMRTNGEHNLLLSRLPSAAQVFDVGSNVGEWAALALDLAPGARIHCFEPGGDAFARLAARGFPDRVVLNRLGIGAAEERRRFYVGGNSELGSLHRRSGMDALFAGTQAAPREEEIALTTLDAYCARGGIGRIDFLKLDVEGNEVPALHGARALFRRRAVGLCTVEYGGAFIDSRHLLKDVFAFAGEVGYRMYKVFPNVLLPFDAYDPRYENFQYANWVLLPR